MPSNWSSAGDTRDPANARLQETDNIRHHRFRQAKNVENRNADGASRAREVTSCSMKESASGLDRPPVSMPSTTSWHRPPSHNSDVQVPQLGVRLTVTPASRHTRARVRWVGTTLERRRPERGHAARCWPRKSREPPHSHLASVIDSGGQSLSRTNGTTTASRGTRLLWAPHATPDWHMVQSVIAMGLVGNTRLGKHTVSRKWCSELEAEQYCQP